MKFVRFFCFCLFSVLVNAIVLAQSGGLPVVSEMSTLNLAPKADLGKARTTSQLLRGQSMSRNKVTSSEASGLNFAPAVVYSSGGDQPVSTSLVDVNRDGILDIVVANEYSNTASVLLGNGDGTFQTAASFGSGGQYPDWVTVADINGDGKPDLLVTNWCGGANCGSPGPGSVGVLLGNGDGTFQAATTYASGGTAAFSGAAADVNGDGKPDLIVANYCDSSGNCGGSGAVGVLLGNGDGSFQAPATYASGGPSAYSVVVADLNFDHKDDIVVANLLAANVGVLLGNGDGTFQAAVDSGSIGYETYSVTLADVNGDGKLDIIVASYCNIINNCVNGTVGVLLGNGDGTFQNPVDYSSGGYGATSVTVADVNGDGKPDVVVGNNCNSIDDCTEGTVAVLLGNGDGTFQNPVDYSSGEYNPYSAALAVADVNGDGKPDIVVAGNCDSANCNGIVSVLINTTTQVTTTTLSSSPNPSNFGQSVTFTASVTAQPIFNKTTPTGTVSFFNGSASLGSSPLTSSGMATLTTSAIGIGTSNITATYNGDTNFGSSTSPVLSQIVLGAIAQISPTSLSFGNQTVGIASASQTVTLSNTGNIPLTLSIGLTGTNSGDFSQTNNCGTSVAAAGSCTVVVTFTPAASGTRTAAVTLTDNAANSPQSVLLSGVGVMPSVNFSPSSLTFPTQVVFTASAVQTATLTNVGVGILTITKIATTAQFLQSNDCGASVAPGASCTISVKFRPTGINRISGTVTVSDNASGSPQNLPLSGTGTYVQLSPSAVNFGNQPLHTKSAPKKITLSNKGNVPVSITKIYISGLDTGDFAEVTTCGTSVAAGANCSITVTFTPLVKGKRAADVSVSDNGGGSPQTVSLFGTGT